jgi:hypothetical protein
VRNAGTGRENVNLTSYPALRTLDPVRRYARELADSGRFADWQALEGFLCVRYGPDRTRRALNDLSVRDELDVRCVLAQTKHHAN